MLATQHPMELLPLLTTRSTQISLHLDSSIAYWVLLPISFAMLLAGLLSHYIDLANRAHPTTSTTLIQHHSVLNYCKNLRKTYLLLPTAGYTAIKTRLLDSIDFGVHLDAGKYRSSEFDHEDESHIDPSAVMSSMFKQIFQIVPNTLQFAWISYFFTGFIVAQFPFTSASLLPTNFKAMFHHSIPYSVSTGLHTSYISSISWYILNLLGLSSFRQLIISNDIVTNGNTSSSEYQFNSIVGNNNDTSFNDLVHQQTFGMSLPQQDQFAALNPFTGGAPDFTRELATHREELNIVQHNTTTLEFSQIQLLQSYRKTRQNRAKITSPTAPLLDNNNDTCIKSCSFENKIVHTEAIVTKNNDKKPKQD